MVASPELSRQAHLQSSGAEALRWPPVSLRTNARV